MEVCVVYDVTITMTNGKVFRFQTDDEAKPNEYEYKHEHNQLFWVPVGDGGVYLNLMQVAYAEFAPLGKK